MDQVTILHAVADQFGTPAQKKMNKYVYANGEIHFDGKHMFWSEEKREINDIFSLYELLQDVTQRDDVIIIRDVFARGDRTYTRRKGEFFKEVPLHWLCLDIDDESVPEGVDPTSIEAVEEIIKRLPKEFHDATYIVHFSSKAGLRGQIVKIHLWVILKYPFRSKQLKRWSESLAVEIDSSLFNRTQPHLVGDPTFQNPEMDPFRNRGKNRLVLVEKSRASVPLLLNENTPTSSRVYKEGVGVFSESTEQFRPESYNAEGMLIDQREKLHLKIRFHFMHKGYTDFDQFAADVFSAFCQRAKLGTTVCGGSSPLI